MSLGGKPAARGEGNPTAHNFFYEGLRENRRTVTYQRARLITLRWGFIVRATFARLGGVTRVAVV